MSTDGSDPSTRNEPQTPAADAQPGARRALRRTLVNVLLSLGSLVVTLLVVELSVRLVVSRRSGGKEQETRVLYTQHDPLLGWRKTPGKRVRYQRREYTTDVTINSLGLRDIERRFENPDGAYRILLLGDSFLEAFSVGLEDSISQRLESLLSSTQRRIEVINAGTVGYSNDQEYLYYRSEGQRFGAQVVLLFLYHNDVLANDAMSWNGRFKPVMSFTTGYLRIGNVPVPVGEAILPAPRRRVEFRGSLALDLAADRLFEAAPDLYARVERLGLLPKQQIRTISNEFDVFRKEWPDPTRRAMPLTTDIIKACAEESWKHDARFALVYIPTRMEVDDRAWRSTVARYGLDPDAWDRSRLATTLERAGREGRYPVLDLTPALRGAISFWRGHTYYAHDSHWNARGHAVAAHEVERFLRSLGWLPT